MPPSLLTVHVLTMIQVFTGARTEFGSQGRAMLPHWIHSVVSGVFVFGSHMWWCGFISAWLNVMYVVTGKAGEVPKYQRLGRRENLYPL